MSPPFRREQYELLRQLRNRPENRRWFFCADERSREEQKAWYRQYLEKENDYMFTVTLPTAPDEFVGTVAVYDYRPEDDSFEIGRLLLDSRKPECRGLGKEIVHCVCQIVEKQFPARMCSALRAEIFEDNERSVRCFLANGFQACGARILHSRHVVLMRRAIKIEEME